MMRLDRNVLTYTPRQNWSQETKEGPAYQCNASKQPPNNFLNSVLTFEEDSLKTPLLQEGSNFSSTLEE